MASDKSGRGDRTVYDQSSKDDEAILSESLRREASSAGEKIHEAGLQIKSKVADLGADVQAATAEQITTLQSRLAEGITAYADAADEASRAFADKESTRTAELMQSAAGVLRDLAGSLSNKPIANVVDDLRGYGRSHPAILVGGAMLAGIAIGRLMRSSPGTGPGSQGKDRL